MTFLGPEGINRRMAELQARLDALSPSTNSPQFDTATATAFQDHLGACGGNVPMEPVIGAASPILGQIGGKSELQAMAFAAANKHGVNPDLFNQLIEAESAWDPSATSRVGAKGLCQLMDPTARGLGVQDSYDPAQNLEGGAKYLREMLDTFNGDRSKALAAYNAGPNFVKHNPPGAWSRETTGYVSRILGGLKPSSL